MIEKMCETYSEMHMVIEEKCVINKIYEKDGNVSSD
jgi:hypothetical protein